MARVVLNQAAIDALASDPAVLAAVRAEVAEPVAAAMRAGAPKRTGAGARSIHVEDLPDGPGFAVGWDPEHWYLRLAETGSEHQPARPFARPAAEQFRR